MDIVHDLTLLLHFVGFAALFGGAFVQIKGPERVVNPAMRHGALTQLVTGVILVGLAEMNADVDVNHVKVGIKLAVLIVITVLVFVGRRKDPLPAGWFWAIGGLTLANAAIAVFV